MAAHPAVHPSEDVLRALALGKLNDNATAAVMNHLDNCPDCCKVIAALSSDDFLDRLRQAHGSSTTPVPPKALAAVARAEQRPTKPALLPNLPPELAANPHYEILGELGRGGMGVVYLAKNKLMDRLEVLKVVNKSLLDHPGAVERFLREIRSAAKLNHANVVTAYSAVQQGELLAFAMEYVEGQDLASLVKARGPLPVPHACYYVQQAALGLQHAHEEKMVHRDIKPQNLMLTNKGKKHIVKVLDFGLAKVMREKQDDTGLTGEGKMLGTPDYIAPEQTLDAAKADIRADIYSLGCTLYYLLSGRPPFSATSLGAVLMAHHSQEAKPLNLMRPEVPEELAAVVRKMMAKDPAKRYQTPLQVVQALTPFVKQGAIPKTAPELSSDAVEAKPVVKKTVRVDPLPVPAFQEAKKQTEEENVWVSLTENSVTSVSPRKSAVVRKPRTATGRERTASNKWLFGGGLAAGVLLLALLGMWAGGVFKVKTKHGTIVLENLAADAEVLVDGESVNVKWGDGGKTAHITVVRGRHKIVATKDGIQFIGEEVEIKDGDHRVLTATLRDTKPIHKAENEPPDEKWVREVAALPAEAQVKAVADKLKERNPGFDGLVTSKVETGTVTELEFVADQVTDISPVRALTRLRALRCLGSARAKGRLADLSPLKNMQLTLLGCAFTQVSDLSPLKGMPLTWLDCAGTRVSDLSPLKGMRLTWLNCAYTQVSDLSPLKGMKLTSLEFYVTPVWDLAPLKGMPLTQLNCANTQVSDLSPLKDMKKLTWLHCEGTPVSDLSPLTDMKLTNLRCDSTRVSGLSPLRGMPLKELACDFRPERDTGILRSIKTLQTFNGKPVAEVLKPADGFVSLFNGKDSQGWHASENTKSNWRVEGGILIGTGGEGYLITDRSDFENFRLRVEAMLGEGGDSGVCFRVQDGHSRSAYEAQIGGSLPGSVQTGSLVLFKGSRGNAMLAPAPRLVPPGQWFTMEILADGNQFTIWVDGQQTIHYEDKNRSYARGAISLQQYIGPKTPVSFRRVEIKELPPARTEAPPAESGKPEDKGFVPLFNGKNLKGWRPHPTQPGNWRVEKGILIGSGSTASHLYSTRGNYKDFRLRVEARINGGGNSGVCFRTGAGPAFPANNPRFPLGYEAQIYNGKPGEQNQTGSLYTVQQRADSGNVAVSIHDSLVSSGNWFTLEVIAEGNHIVVKVNGKTTADYTDEKALYKSGHIALQQHDAATVVEFRKIEIKEIDRGRSITTASGLKYEGLKEGTGVAARKGDTVEVHYTGWLTSGKKFDSSHDRGQVFSFTLGAGKVIKGWEEGVAGMRVGGKRRLTIPPELAYGKRGAGNDIPADATLIFEIELLKIK